MECSSKYKFSIIRELFLSIVLFLFSFEWTLFGVLTTRRIAILIAILYLLISGRTKKRIRMFHFQKHIQSMFLLIIPFLFTVVNTIGLEKNPAYEYFEPWHFINIFLYCVVFSLFIIVYVRDAKEYYYAYIGIISLQSIFVYIALISTPFRLFLYNNFYDGDNRFERFIQNGTRIMGVALHSSLGSITMLCALIILVYLARTKKINNVVFLIFYGFNLGATALIGRTGFYIGLIILFFYLFSSKLFIKRILITIVGIAIAILLLESLTKYVEIGSWNYLVKWIGEIFNADTRFKTIDTLREYAIPPLTWDTLWGTTVLRGSYGNIEIYNDSGYVEMFFSLGLFGAIWYYLGFVLSFVSILRNIKKEKVFFIVLFLIMLVIEYKEPYIRKYIYTSFLLTFMLLHTYSKENYDYI